ncbi:MAG: T9SS type A sorting domain-containing protein, partial [Bacteroidia bacterium]
PNPSNGTLYIWQKNGAEPLNITISDLNGRTVHEEKISDSGAIHINCANGLYILRLIDPVKGTVHTQKLIIQK